MHVPPRTPEGRRQTDNHNSLADAAPAAERRAQEAAQNTERGRLHH